MFVSCIISFFILSGSCGAAVSPLANVYPVQYCTLLAWYVLRLFEYCLDVDFTISRCENFVSSSYSEMGLNCDGRIHFGVNADRSAERWTQSCSSRSATFGLNGCNAQCVCTSFAHRWRSETMSLRTNFDHSKKLVQVGVGRTDEDTGKSHMQLCRWARLYLLDASAPSSVCGYMRKTSRM